MKSCSSVASNLRFCVIKFGFHIRSKDESMHCFNVAIKIYKYIEELLSIIQATSLNIQNKFVL